MKIGISAIQYRPDKQGGTETYLLNLWKELQIVDQENSYEIYCNKNCHPSFPISRNNFSHSYLNYYRWSFNWLVRGIIRRATGLDILIEKFNKMDVDIIHHPLTTLVPSGISKPSVLTFADMQHEFYPDFFSKNELQLRKMTYAPSVSEATRVIVNSQFTKQNLVERYGTNEDKIDVISHGYGPSFKPIQNQSLLNNILSKYNITKPFIYYPAATWPHKNHKNLLHALKLLKDRYKFDGYLVLTGIAMNNHGHIENIIKELGINSQVKILGYLPFSELPALYNLATITVFPSLFEGFGIPIAEAMACGCPVVCSNATCLPEVAGEAALFFDPLAIDQIAEQIWLVWTDDSMQSEMSHKGIKRASLFRWEEIAKQTVKVYKKALKS